MGCRGAFEEGGAFCLSWWGEANVSSRWQDMRWGYNVALEKEIGGLVGLCVVVSWVGFLRCHSCILMCGSFVHISNTGLGILVVPSLMAHFDAPTIQPLSQIKNAMKASIL